jgi:hypothetical protein
LRNIPISIWIICLRRFHHLSFGSKKTAGGQKLGQEIMVTVGIGQFYSSKEGFYSDNLKNAQAIYEAIKRSNCSAEVKVETDKIAEDYHLYDR